VGTAYCPPVLPAVNRAANDGPELLMPLAAAPPVAEPAASTAKRSRKPKEDDRQASLFGDS
jgi:hypothetical protein